MWDLKLPASLPYMLGGLRIAGGLSLIGAVVAEIAAGSGGAGSGLAFRIVEARIPPQHPAHVRGAAAALRRRHGDFLSARRWSITWRCAAGTKARLIASDKGHAAGRLIASTRGHMQMPRARRRHGFAAGMRCRRRR